MAGVDGCSGRKTAVEMRVWFAAFGVLGAKAIGCWLAFSFLLWFLRFAACHSHTLGFRRTLRSWASLGLVRQAPCPCWW